MIALKSLTISSILVFLSIVTFNPKLIGVSFILYISVIIWNMNIIIPTFSIQEFINYNTKEIIKAYEEKKYFCSFINLILIPFTLIGLIVVFIDIYCLLFLM